MGRCRYSSAGNGGHKFFGEEGGDQGHKYGPHEARNHSANDDPGPVDLAHLNLWQVKSSTEAASPFRFGEIEFEGYVPIKIRNLPQKDGAVPSAGEDGVDAFSYRSARNCRTGLWSSFFATT